MATTTRALAVVAALAGVVHAQPRKADDESAAFVDEGRAALKTGALEDAAKALDQAITLNPRRVDAYVLRAAVYAAKQDYKAGVALLRRAQGLAPTDEDVLTALGSALVLDGNTAEGIPILQAVIAKTPDRYDAQLLVGLDLHANGKWPEAIAALEAYFRARPAALAKEDARHRVALADSYLRYRQPQKALALFQQAASERGRKVDIRTQIGIAWATAAIDCKQARPLLHDLELVAELHPEIWLVDGECALALGDTATALAQGKKYLDKVPKGAAAAHALLGEAQAVRGNLVEARRELETARGMEPARRRWTVRYAHVVRRGGDPATALEALDQLGPPTTPGIDPDWWREIGEALLAKPDAATAVSRLAPIATGELAGDQELHVIFGAAELASGQPEVAIKTFDELAAQTPRSTKLLQDALAQVGTAKLVAGDVAGAEPILQRAEAIEGAPPSVARNLGIARLAQNKNAEAMAALDRAAKADAGSGTVLMLDARAHALTNDLPGARGLYERALVASPGAVGARSDAQRREGTTDADIALDWAAAELGPGGDPAIAVSALEKAAPKSPKTDVPARYKAALADARHAAGLVALRAGNAQKAVELLRAAAATDPTIASKCDLAVAMVAADNPGAAMTALTAIRGQSCPFPPPADVQAAPILLAFSDGLNPRRAAAALDKLTSLGGKSSGAAAALLGTSIRVVALNAAQDAYRNGNTAGARKYLTTAQSARAANARVGADEIAHDLAVIDLADGKLDAAIAQLERVAGKIPEALVNLGIAYERKNEPQKALDAWRRAKKAGVRFAPLNDWIENKERIYGAEAAP